MAEKSTPVQKAEQSGKVDENVMSPNIGVASYGSLPMVGISAPVEKDEKSGKVDENVMSSNIGFASYGSLPMVGKSAPVEKAEESGKVDENAISPNRLLEVDILFKRPSDFTDKAIRAVFIRKVYAILMLQLLFTFSIVALFVFEPHAKMFVRRRPFFYYFSYFIFIGVSLSLACCGDIRRHYPENMMLLSIFTMSMSYMLGAISSFYGTDVVFLAVGICATVCLAVSVFSCYSKFDFTSCGGFLFVLLWLLFIFGIITFITRNHIMNTVYAGCGALVFILFLAYDTQMLVGGKKFELSPEEYIFAAMQIYLDIVNIFLNILIQFATE